MNSENNGNQPEKKFSTGAICATIWKNIGKSKNGQEVEFRTIQLDRRYKDKEDNWQSTNSLRVNDLPKAALVLSKAYEYLVLRGTRSSSKEEEQAFEEIVM
ncbi:hypothetical protein GF323_00460 [Candidatus Woesearchaeota archaeon]|nr:hypothetical protein [Candidatus Woesearchaeota archaeon]